MARLRLGTPQGLGADECWPWQGRRTAAGYGLIWYTEDGKRSSTTANHVIAIAAGLPTDSRQHVGRHSCDHGWCCNPAHVLGGTQGQNMADMVERGRADYQRGHKRRFSTRIRTLSDDDVRAIRAATDESLSSLSEQYGVKMPQISKIRRRLAKAGVPD